MGVNMAGNCICDDAVCCEASRQEIVRRYYDSLNALLKGNSPEEEAQKIELLMNQANVTIQDRHVVAAALKRAEETHTPAAALELDDGRIITGKTTNLLGASAALLLNVIKELAGLKHELHIISPESIEPIQKLKVDYLKSKTQDFILMKYSSHFPQALPPTRMPDLHFSSFQIKRMSGSYFRYAVRC